MPNRKPLRREGRGAGALHATYPVEFRLDLPAGRGGCHRLAVRPAPGRHRVRPRPRRRRDEWGLSYVAVGERYAPVVAAPAGT